jgi:hypothetical protein
MDSDEDFISNPPSGDEMDFEEGTQDSDIGSIGGGEFALKISMICPLGGCR